ncbi:augmin complex subunit msd5 [Drosophila innubila]|uniref:augmin complex subunit msd5 n=1 Tax=Drosophila innubila TaxID=198719 RepID=UPI00148C41C8|nr:augmin complex subunit msd5 [Drosophila innubila]
MDPSDVGFDFSEFSSEFDKNFKENAINLKELCITRSIVKPADFFKNLQQHMQDEASQTTPTKKLGTVAEYAELFKVLDTYPSNLQRISKKRELQRANSTILKGNDTTTQDQTTINTSSPSLSLNITRQEDERTAAEVYTDFKNFQQKLRNVYEETAALKNRQSEYMGMINQLQNFTQQLEKLMPGQREAPDAFTASEEANLVGIAENLKQLNYMRTNSLSKVANPRETAVARLEILVDILTYTLLQISCYNNA